MQDYYGNVMDMAIEKISTYTDHMDSLNGVLDHYSNILDLIGKKQDYATKNAVLEGKVSNLQNDIKIQSQLYQDYAAQVAYWQEQMLNSDINSVDYETFEKNWKAAQDATNDAQDKLLSSTKEWLETTKAIIENEFAEIAEIMEKSLTGGISFDSLITSMERRSSLQEEYLTTTNKIYETNKLMRTAQQEIDKTTNTVAKNKLKNFIQETNQLQNQTKLSKHELEIQQAKYDLLLAEIALQEAQNAKSTVRLQRDSEGNIGYIYTADPNQVSEAQQKLEDAQNSLYNIGLEGANDYAQKYADTMKEAQDAITELNIAWMNGEIETEEEYQRRKTEIVETYGEQLKQFSDLFGVAVSADSRVIRDSWAADFMDITASTEEWKNTINQYFDEADMRRDEWTETSKTATAITGIEDIGKAVDDVTNSSNILTEALTGENGLIEAMAEQTTAASELSSAFVEVQKAIDKVIASGEKMLEVVNGRINNPAEPGDENAESSSSADFSSDANTSENAAASSITWDRAYGAFKRINAGAWGNGMNNRIKNGAAEGYTEEEVRAGQDLINKVYDGMTIEQAKSAIGFDTGGYTGAWGPYGKLAMLHEKELVLNANDTENLLTSMEFLARILELIDLQSMSHQLSNIASPSMNNSNQSKIEQSVHIEANFPNATDRGEIEEAFNNLINTASQYANRK